MHSYDLSNNNAVKSSSSSQSSQSSRRSSLQDMNQQLTRFLPTGRYQLVKEWDFSDSAQSVCALTAMNSTLSNYILCSTSDKMIHVLDADQGAVLRRFPSPHDRNICHIAISSPSPHVPLPRHVHNVFLTMAPDNLVVMVSPRVCPWPFNELTVCFSFLFVVVSVGSPAAVDDPALHGPRSSSRCLELLFLAVYAVLCYRL